MTDLCFEQEIEEENNGEKIQNKVKIIYRDKMMSKFLLQNIKYDKFMIKFC